MFSHNMRPDMVEIADDAFESISGLRSSVETVFKLLDEREATMICQHFLVGMDVTAVAKYHKITRQSASRIIHEALKRVHCAFPDES